MKNLGEKIRVLFVDDELRFLLEILIESLKPHNYQGLKFEIHGAHNSTKAFEILNNLQNDSSDPILAIVDLNLGEGDISGYEIISHLFTKDIPTIALSASSRQEDAVMALRSGANDFVYKEEGLDLIERVTATLDKFFEKKRSQSLAEEVLRQSEVKYKLLAENASDVIWTTDMNLNFTYFSPSVEKLRGFTADEVLAQKAEQTLTPDSYKKALETLAQELENEKIPNINLQRSIILELEQCCKDGTTVWAEVSLKFIRDEENKPISIIGISRNISERKKAEISLKKSEEMFRNLIEASPDGIVIADINTMQFKYANPAFCAFLGYSQSEIVNMQLKDIHPENDLAYVILEFEKQAKGEKKLATNIPCLRKDRTIVFADFNALRIVYNGSECNLGFVRDMTEIKRLQEQLEQRQRMGSVVTLANGIAHDFNNMLAAIMGFLGVLQSSNLDDEQKEDVAEALDAACKARTLIKQIQSLSAIGFPQSTIIDVNEAVENVLSMLERTSEKLIKKLNLVPEKKFYIKSDTTEFFQVLLNLGINAVDAITQKGVTSQDWIKIWAEDYVIKSYDKTGLSPGQYVHLYFEDTGCGMSEEIRKKAFDPLFTTKDDYTRKGQGLGLAMVWTIITNKCHGFIEIESKQDKGTIFHLYLPTVEPEEIDDKKETTTDLLRKKTILFVDDESTLLKGIGRFFRDKKEFKILQANDGEEALEIYSANAEFIDLVIMDLIMPKMSGKELMQKMLEINSNVKVVIYAGNISNEKQKDPVLGSAIAFWDKPLVPDELLKRIKKILDKPE